MIHLNNAPVYNSKPLNEFLEAVNAQRILRPPYSHDISPIYFFLFEFVKEYLRGRSVCCSGNLISEVAEIVRSHSNNSPVAVYRNWMKRPR
jgi:hypothetical protein